MNSAMCVAHANMKMARRNDYENEGFRDSSSYGDQAGNCHEKTGGAKRRSQPPLRFFLISHDVKRGPAPARRTNHKGEPDIRRLSSYKPAGETHSVPHISPHWGRLWLDSSTAKQDGTRVHFQPEDKACKRKHRAGVTI